MASRVMLSLLEPVSEADVIVGLCFVQLLLQLLRA
jgi:heme/copper-type cytochrome/quinol oxidase subunit 4